MIFMNIFWLFNQIMIWMTFSAHWNRIFYQRMKNRDLLAFIIVILREIDHFPADRVQISWSHFEYFGT